MNMTNMLNAKPTSFTFISLLPLFFFSFLCRHIRSVSVVVFESPVVQRKCRNTVSIKTRHQVRGTLILDCEKLLHVENWFRTSYPTRRDEHKFITEYLTRRDYGGMFFRYIQIKTLLLIWFCCQLLHSDRRKHCDKNEVVILWDFIWNWITSSSLLSDLWFAIEHRLCPTLKHIPPTIDCQLS